MSAISPAKQLCEPSTGHWNRLDWILSAVLALLTLAIYLQSRHFDFIEYDDHLYVYRNLHVLQGLSLANLRWALTVILYGNWHPLTLVVLLTLSSLFGPTPGTFHVANTILHVLNVVLLYTFLRKSTGRAWPAFFTAALWGLHPLRVESVVWISELKDELFGLFWLLCMLAYLRYRRSRSVSDYSLVGLLLALSLLAKPMAATLPGVLLLLDLWPIPLASPGEKNVRWWRDRLLEKIPLLLVSVADSVYAVSTQRRAVSLPAQGFSLDLRCRNAIVSLVAYLRDIFAPYHLSLFYPHPGLNDQTIPMAQVVLAAGLLLLITVVVITNRRGKPYLLVGWFWFLGTLAPVLGIIRLGEASRADRYTYIPSIGITFAVVWFVSDWVSLSLPLRRAASVLGFVALGASLFATAEFVPLWKDTPTLYHYMLAIQPDNPLVVTYHANELWKQGRTDEALAEGQRAVALSPRNGAAHMACAAALQAAKKYPEAVEEFAAGIRLDRGDDSYWDALGSVRALQADAYAEKHDPQEKIYREKSLVDFRIALKLDMDNLDAREHLALQLAELGRFDEAIAEWRELIAMMPTSAVPHGQLADALRLKEDLAGAVDEYRAALANGSKNPAWETELAYLIATQPQSSPAEIQQVLTYAKDACDQSENRSAAALDTYAICLARVGRFDDAVTTATQGIAQANADHQPIVAAGIARRLALYQQQQPYLATETAVTTTQPTSAPVNTSN